MGGLRLRVGMRRESAIDHSIAALASRQGGVIARRQLVSLGLGMSAIDRRLRSGRLHPLYGGVYAVGHRVIGVVGRRWAAVLACGDGAVLSHASAAAAWEIRATASGLIDVTVGPTGRSRKRGIRLHWRAAPSPPDEIAERDGLPVTTPARTLLDLAASGLRGRPLEAALDRAELLRILDFGDVHALLARYPGRPGTPALNAVLSSYHPANTGTRSVLEELVIELCDSRGIPRPNVNTVIEGRERDFCWPRARLVVEADSYTWHRSPSALNDDRERDVRLTLAGYRVLRFTWHQVTRRRRYVAMALLQALDCGFASPGDANAQSAVRRARAARPPPRRSARTPCRCRRARGSRRARGPRPPRRRRSPGSAAGPPRGRRDSRARRLRDPPR